jgi:hypothetical protein
MKPKQKIKVFLDSGAYSAWTSKKTINLKDYISFIKDCEPFLDTYVNLDVIPGTIDRMRTMEDVKASAAASYRNLQIMKDAGLRPLPVFHQQEHYSWLEKMLKDGEKYIGISSAKNQTNLVQERWLDEFFTIVCNKEGWPLVKVHGFGSAHVDMLKRHPYYSVDSAGWRIAAAYGKMYVPQYINNKPDYLRPPVLVTISGNFQTSKHSQSRQLSNPAFFGPSTQEVVRRFLEEEVGVNIGLARYSNQIRYRALAVYYQRVSEALTSVRHTHPRGSFGSGESSVRSALARRGPINMDHVQFIFSTGYDHDNCQALLEADAYHHLLSFWEFRTRPAKADKRSRVPRRELMRAYVFEGKVAQRPSRPMEADWTNQRYVMYRGRSLAQRILKAKKETTDVVTRRPHIKPRDGKAGSRG